MNYNIFFYIAIFAYFYFSITGNIEMKENAFQGTVVLGFLNILNRR